MYEKVYNFNDFPNADSFIYQIIAYLLDLPRRDYEPSHEGARADLIRMLYYDDIDCLDAQTHPLPSAKEKKSLIYNPKVPTPTEQQAPKGYRIFLQPRIGEVQTEQKVELRVFPGEIQPLSDFRAIQAIEFQVLCGMSQDTLQNSISRSYKIVLDIIRALNGRDIGSGVNTIHFNRNYYRFCRTEYFNDGKFNVGYYLTMATEFAVGNSEY